jgi:hypothetical protein
MHNAGLAAAVFAVIYRKKQRTSGVIVANFGIPAASDSSGMEDPGPFEFDGTSRTATVAAGHRLT